MDFGQWLNEAMGGAASDPSNQSIPVQLLYAMTGGFGAADATAAKQAEQAAAEQYQQGFREQQGLLDPYQQAGADATAMQRALAGLDGPEAQQQAIAMIQNSPEFAAMAQQGEEAILANASATGGLRGGNTQQALAQFRPQLLSQLIEQQYGRLGGLGAQGLGAATTGAGLGADLRSGLAGIRSGGILGQAQAYRDARQQVTDLGMAGIGVAGKLGGAAVGLPTGVL